jgi:hypothetical protein
VSEIIKESDHFAVGGDFSNVFDSEDYLAMVNARDESALVLRAHLILEEFLNIWAARTTGAPDLFAGQFISFRTKLQISENLGMAADIAEVLDRFNALRNGFSHRRKHKIETSTLIALCSKVDALQSAGRTFTPCQAFEIYAEGNGPEGHRVNVSHTWSDADAIRKLLIVFIVFVMKFVVWMQAEFNRRGIACTLVTSPVADFVK